MPNGLADIHEKLHRAQEHIDEIKAAVNAFLDETSNRCLFDYDPDAAETFRSFHQYRRVPVRVSIITGETIYQLRSSLDYLACALIRYEGGTPTSTTQFPIFSHQPATQKQVRRYEGQIAGIHRPAVRAAIERHQPYLRGNRAGGDWLAILKAFSNLDKHQGLVLHETSVQPRFKIHMRTADLETWSDRIDDGTQTTVTVTAESEFVEVVNVQRSLATYVSFSQWGDTGRTIEVVNGLTAFHNGIARIVRDFEPFLR